MPATVDLHRLASAISVGVLVTVMVGAGSLTALSRTGWWCEQQAEAEVEALRAVARTHFPEARLHAQPQVDCSAGVRTIVRTDVPTSGTAPDLRLREAGWTSTEDGLRSPDGRWEATVTSTGTASRVHLSTRD